MSEKKKIKECEWPLLDNFALESNTSLAKVYDVLREGRIERHEDLMNRSWFMHFMRAVCGCVDGKMKGYRRPKGASDSVAKPEVKETSVAEKSVEQVIEPEVKETLVSGESMSELLKKNTLLIMKWMFEHKAQNFNQMITSGFSKSKISKAVKDLENLGILVKKNSKRFERISWEDLAKDFPEITIPLTEEEKNSLLLCPRNKEEVIKREVQEMKEPVQTPVRQTTVKKERPKSDMDRMIDWLLDEEHASNEITKGEVVAELRRMRSVKDPYAAASQLLYSWEQDSAIKKVPGTFAYQILSTAQLLRIMPEIKAEPQLEREETVPIQKPTTSGRDLILRSNGKDIRVVNRSGASLTVTIEHGDVILTIQ